MCPTLGAQPSLRAGLNATVGEPVAFAGGAKFETHDFLHPVLHPGLWLD